ncbi:MAG: tRNA (guanosine(37)-N1)-methyltransferase TrmD [Synergistaceae bacterium]|nr:tRNA (guanosine(37)-N1)-methyltransferase TrmD [Synergistaceae bacterium]
MNVSIITAFPELFTSFLSTSIPGRAVKNNLLRVNLVNLRDFGRGNYRQLDDYAFGSGGMVFAAPQLKAALDFADIEGVKPFVIYPSPQGALISQELIESLAHQEHVIIFCGHYEGLDERFVEKYVDLEISIGDCVLTGGELPAMIIIDSMSRLVPGVVGKSKAVIEDSFYRGMLDNPNYTRPFDWEGLQVPEVLLSGNEKQISRWRRHESIKRTLTRRPDLISRASIRDYLADKVGVVILARDENIDLRGLISLCEAYNLSRPFVIAKSHELRETIKNLYPETKVLGSPAKLSGEQNTLCVKIFPGSRENSLHSLEVKRRCLEHEGSILFIFAQDESELLDERLEGLSSYLYESGLNGLVPLNILIGTALDRFLGKR